MFRVVIADDEEIIRNGLKKLILSYELHLSVVGLAEDGKEAIKLIEEFRPEIILMDINMPFMNGLDVIEKTKYLVPESKIIIISGYDQFDYAQKALHLGVYSYLLKPIRYKEFKNMIVKAIDSYCQRMWERKSIHESESSSVNYKCPGTQAVQYIKEHFYKSDLSLKTLADRLHVSQSYLTKIIKQKTGVSFTDYLNNIRINMAIKLLLDKENDYTINEISRMVGYNSQHYFSRIFKNYTGLSPLQFKSKNM